MREKQHQRGLSSSYLEPDRYDDDEEGEEAISLAAIKSKYKGGGGLRGEWVATIKLTLLPHNFYSSDHCDPITIFCYLPQRSAPRFTRQTVTKARTTTKPRG